MDQALSVAKSIVALKEEEIMIIGGADIYQLAMTEADRLYLTEVALSLYGDAFPKFDAGQWREISRTAYPSLDGAASYTLVIMDKIGIGTGPT